MHIGRTTDAIAPRTFVVVFFFSWHGETISFSFVFFADYSENSEQEVSTLPFPIP